MISTTTDHTKYIYIQGNTLYMQRYHEKTESHFPYSFIAIAKFGFFLASYNSSWSVVCSCELWNLFLICAFLFSCLTFSRLLSKIPSYLNFLLERDLACKRFDFLDFIFFKTFFLWSDPWSDPWSSPVRSGPILIVSTPPKVRIFALETQYVSCFVFFFN